MTSSDAPPPPGGPLREDRPDGPLQPAGDEHGALPDPGDDSPPGSVPPVREEEEQSEAEAAVQEENAGTAGAATSQ